MAASACSFWIWVFNMVRIACKFVFSHSTVFSCACQTHLTCFIVPWSSGGKQGIILSSLANLCAARQIHAVVWMLPSDPQTIAFFASGFDRPVADRDVGFTFMLDALLNEPNLSSSATTWLFLANKQDLPEVCLDAFLWFSFLLPRWFRFSCAVSLECTDQKMNDYAWNRP